MNSNASLAAPAYPSPANQFALAPRAAEPVSMPASAADKAALPPAAKPRTLQVGRSLRALRDLIANPEDTERVFEIYASLDGGAEETFFQQFAADPEGQRLLRERPSLIDALADRGRLRAMPDGSFGRAYLDYMERTGLDAQGLLALKRDFQRREESAMDAECLWDETREWIRDRTVLMHDLWHVLTGYGTDELGEAALLTFMLAQMGGRANALLVLGAGARSTVTVGPRFVPYLWSVYRRGRNAVWLTSLPYEELLSLPLEEVRRRAQIQPAAEAHPAGILRGMLGQTPVQAVAST